MKYTLCVLCGNETTWVQALDYGLCKECDKPENRHKNPDPVMKDKELMYHIRKKLYLNQTEMAKEVGYNSQDAISKIERGRRDLSGPARRCLELLAEKHDIDL